MDPAEDASGRKRAHVAKLRELLAEAKFEGRTQITSFQERSPLYDGLRALLAPGFISKSIEINQVPVCLRTLNFDDMLVLEGRTGMNQESWVDWVIASSIWSFGGQILGNDQEAVIFLYEKIQNLPTALKAPLLITVSLLNARVAEAKDRALSYFYERESRDLWMSRGLTLFSGSFSWVGRNNVQDLWAFYNRMEDERIRRIVEQNMASFTVSPHAPQSIKKMSARAKRDEEQLERDRGIAQDQMFFKAFGVEFDPRRYKNILFDEVIKAETFDELRQQMKDWDEGKKDYHDLVIEQNERRIKTQREFRKWKREKLRRETEEYQRRLQEQGDTRTSTILVGEEAERAIRDLTRRGQGPGRVYDMDNGDHIYDKYLGSNDKVLRMSSEEYEKAMRTIPDEMREFFAQQRSEG